VPPGPQGLLAEIPRLPRAIVAVGEIDVDRAGVCRRTVALGISFCQAGAVRQYQSARLLHPDL
jgi:hypothetical protein